MEINLISQSSPGRFHVQWQGWPVPSTCRLRRAAHEVFYLSFQHHKICSYARLYALFKLIWPNATMTRPDSVPQCLTSSGLALTFPFLICPTYRWILSGWCWQVRKGINANYICYRNMIFKYMCICMNIEWSSSYRSFELYETRGGKRYYTYVYMSHSQYYMHA